MRSWQQGIRRLVELMPQDVRYAARSLRNTPGFTLGVIATLALGIGANAAVFTVADRMLLRPPEHVVDPARVVRLYWNTAEETRSSTAAEVTYPLYEGLHGSVRSFAQLAAYTTPLHAWFGGRGARRTVNTVWASAGFFPLLGVRPALGRFYDTTDDSAGVPVVVVGYRFWQRELGGSRDAIGASVRLDGRVLTVVGVAPEGFTGMELGGVDIWIPVITGERYFWDPKWRDAWRDPRNGMRFRLVARLGPGLTTTRAETEATAVVQRLVAQSPPSASGLGPLGFVDAKTRILVGPIVESRGPGDKSAAESITSRLLAVAILVLLIACANVANLLFARAVFRRREIAVRLALGVSRARLLRQLLTEGILLAATGGMAALLLAYGGGVVLRATLLPGVSWPSGPVDARLLVFTAGLAVAVGVATALLPAIQATRPGMADALKAGWRERSGHRSVARTGLTLVQATLSVVLLVAAGMFITSLWEASTVDLGFDVRHLLVADLQFETPHADSGKAAFAGMLLARARGLSDVEYAAWVPTVPLGFAALLPVVAGSGDSAVTGYAYMYYADRDFFKALGTRIVFGRAFTDADRAGAPAVVIVNERFARTVWHATNPLGQCVQIDPSPSAGCVRVVGVTGNVRAVGLDDRPFSQFYLPIAQHVAEVSAALSSSLLIRTRDDAARAAPRVQGALQAVLPSSVFPQVTRLHDRIDEEMRPWRIGAMLFSVLGLLALIIAAVGLYTVMAYTARQAARDFGVRVAVGAQARDIVTLAVRHGVGTAAAGIVLGLVISTGTAPAIASLLYDAHQPFAGAYLSAAAVLLLAAVGASVVPAWRAMHVDPVTILRTE